MSDRRRLGRSTEGEGLRGGERRGNAHTGFSSRFHSCLPERPDNLRRWIPNAEPALRLEVDGRNSGGGVASLVLGPAKADDPFALPSLDSLLGPPPLATATQTSALLAVDTIFYNSDDGGLYVQYQLSRGLYEARKSEVGFIVETVLFVSNNLGQTRTISPKADPLTLIKTLVAPAGATVVFQTFKAWNRRDQFGNPMTGAATVAYTSQLLFSPSGAQRTFANSLISGTKAIELPLT